MKEQKENLKPESVKPLPPKPPVKKSAAEKDLDLLKTEIPLVPIADDVFVVSKSEKQIEGEFETPNEFKKSTFVPDVDPIEQLAINAIEAEEVYEIPETQFKTPLDQVERKHYQIVLKANKETIADLRKQLTVALTENKRLSKKQENENEL